tara:strand:- start:2581 stop:2685 length:105 start_codon:yes stop_codon:yes gene_type:complete
MGVIGVLKTKITKERIISIPSLAGLWKGRKKDSK